MSDKEDSARRDEVLLRMLKTPPQPHKPKGKVELERPSGPAKKGKRRK